MTETSKVTTAFAGAIKSVAANMAIMFAAALAFKAVAAAFDYFYNPITELNEKAAESAEELTIELDNVRGKIESINNEIQTTSNRIQELNALPHRSFVEEEELTNLQIQNEELQREKELLEALELSKSKKASDDAAASLSAKGTYNRYVGFNNDIDNIDQAFGQAYYEQYKGSLVEMFDQQLNDLDVLRARKAEVEKAFMENHYEAYYDETIPSIYRDELNSLNAEIEFLEQSTADSASSIDDLRGLLDKATHAELYKSATEAIDKYINSTKTAKERTDDFSKIWNSNSFEFARKELLKLAEAGQLTANKLENIALQGNLAKSLTDEERAIVDHYHSIITEINQKGIDIHKTIFNNIDTNNRQVLEWNAKNLNKYASELRSWGYTDDDFIDIRGSYSTVMGMSSSYDGIEIAFSPILQTTNGPVLLSAETVDKYIWALFDKAHADGKFNSQELLSFDVEGLEIEGQQIKGLLAEVGEEALHVGEAMHYTGELGAHKTAFKEATKIAEKYGATLNDVSKSNLFSSDLTWIKQANPLVGSENVDFEALANQINSLVQKEQAALAETKLFSEELAELPLEKLEQYVAMTKSGDLTAKNINTFEDLATILRKVGIDGEEAFEKLQEFSENYNLSVDLMSGIQDSYKVLDDVKEEVKESGEIGLESLKAITAQYPELNTAIALYKQGLISEQELLNQLKVAYEKDADAYRASMVDKLQSDAEFFNIVSSNNTELITGLSEAYQDDSDNWASLAEAKASIDETLIQRLSEGWSEYFGYIIDANTGLMHLTANTVPEDESADYLAAYAALNEIVTARNDLIEASKLQINLPDNFKSKKADVNGDGGGDNSTSENEIDWIQRKNEILQRLHDEQLALADDETNSYNERIAALKELIEKDKERAEIARQSANKYNEAWEEAASKIDAKDRERIENGSLEIIDYTEAGYDDEYVKNLQKAQELYDQKVEAESNANEIEKDSEEHRRKELQLLGEIISAQQEILDNEKATLEAKIEMAEVTGKYVGAGSYKDLIENSKEMESSLRDQIENLEEQITLVDEDSAEYNSLKASIADCEQSITECQIQQAEWNETIERLPVERIQTYITLLQHTIEDFDNFLSQQSQIGINPNKEQYQTYIDLYTDQITELLKKQEKLVEIQSKYDYGSEKYKEYADEIQGIDSEISGLIDKQLEYNDAILQIPINEMSEQYDNLAEIRATLDREIAEDNAKGLSTTIDQYSELNKLTLQQLQLLVARRTALEGLLNVYDEDSDKYRETQDAINGINGEISSLVQEQYNWNQEILNMPTEKLEKINDNLSNYSSILGSVLEDYDSALAGINTLIDGQIEGIQDQLDLLSQTNEARKIQLGLEQALYNLERAKEQKNIKVIRDGKVQYEADQDALRDAQQELADAQYDKMVYDLEQQIDALENIKDKWQEIIDKIQEAKDLQSAEDLFGEGWQDSVLADSQDLRDIFQNLYSSTSAQKESIDREIESNERLVSMMGEFVTRYQEGSLTYEQALAGINSTISAMGDGFSALEQLGGMMNLDNIASLGDIASSAEAGITGSAALLKDYLTIVESNKESVEGFETVWGGMSESIDEAIKAFNEAVDSMETYLDVFAANSNAINANTSNWEEMKSNIEAQVEALKAAAEALEKQANSSSGNKKPASSSTSSRDDDDGGGVYISAGGNSYHESTGTTAEIIGSYGSDKEKSDYSKIRYDQLDKKRETEGEGWYNAAKKALDEELKKAGLPTYHSGIENGLVKTSNSSFERFIKSIAIDPLKSDEVIAKLQMGEGVFTQPQMSNLVNNSMLMGRIYDQTTGGYKTTSGTSVDFSIGELHLHEVQNPDELANALKQSFASSMRQNFTEVFKK